MNSSIQSLLSGVCFLVVASTALAASDVTITPMKGQTAEQVALDQSECSTSATGATGFDPAADSANVGGRARGAAKGAALGAAGAEIRGNRNGGEAYDRAGDNAKQEYRQENAKDVAKVGAVAGGVRQRQDRREDRSSAEAWDQSYRSCLSGRGYTVK